MLESSYKEEHMIAAVEFIAVPALSKNFHNISSDITAAKYLHIVSFVSKLTQTSWKKITFSRS
jgi:hypothetical protein